MNGNKKRNIWQIIGVFIVILTVARETGYITADYYRSNASFSSNSVTNSSSNTSTRGENMGREIKKPQTRVIVIYMGKEYGDANPSITVLTSNISNPPLRIDISDISFGVFLWTPLYKYTSIDYTKSLSHNTSIYGNGINSSFSTIGHINVNGTFSIKGICSHKTAKEIVLQKVMSDIYKQAKSNI